MVTNQFFEIPRFPLLPQLIPTVAGNKFWGSYESPEEQREMIKKGELLRAEDIAVGMHYVLTQPFRCEITTLGIREHHE